MALANRPSDGLAQPLQLARPAPLLLALALTLAAGCGQEKKSDAPDETDTTTATAVDPQLEAEYQRLPATILLGVAVDDQGRDVLGSAEMRLPADPSAAIDNEASARRLFESGTPAKHVASVDGLDADSSTQAWSSFTGTTDYASFQPLAYSRAQAGQSYTYTPGTRYKTGDKAVYVYRRPDCRPPYCRPGSGDPGQPGTDLDQTLAEAMAKVGVRPLANDDWYVGSREQIELGARLFNDKLLSAKGDVACASCHVDRLGTGGLESLGPTGEVIGGRKRTGFGVNDVLGRNAPPLFNLGHKSVTTMFWDGRIEASASSPSGFVSPAGDDLPLGLDNALAVQALFPLVAGNEMGCGAAAMVAELATSPTQSWNDIMKRVLKKREYQTMFQAAFPQESRPGVAQLANAIAAYEADRWRADNSPFDRYLRGDKRALSKGQKIGASYFYGKANCAGCHSGTLQTDRGYHAIAIPQWGPGAGDGAGLEDHGRGRITGNAADRYKFRTPSLRNVAVTGPWGHTGAYRSLRKFVSHYTNPRANHDKWRPTEAVLPRGFQLTTSLQGAWNDPAARQAVRAANVIDGIPLTEEEIDHLVEFLMSLTDGRVAHDER